MLFTARVIRSASCVLDSSALRDRLGIQSKINTDASSCFINARIGSSNLPLPENPRLTMGLGSARPTRLAKTKPGRVAQAPCEMEVAQATIGIASHWLIRFILWVPLPAISIHSKVLYKGKYKR